MPGGCWAAKPASVAFVLSQNRARRGSDLPINPEPEPSAELQGEEVGLGVAKGGQRAAASGGRRGWWGAG